MAKSKWWSSLTPKQKQQYIKKHPNSLYARGVGSPLNKMTRKKAALIGAGVAGLGTAAHLAHSAHSLGHLHAIGNAVREWWENDGNTMLQP